MDHPLFARVILDDGIDHPLDYSVPQELSSIIHKGSRVEVPVRNQKRWGTVIEMMNECAYPSVKAIYALSSQTVHIQKDLLTLLEWVASYYGTPLRKIIKLALPPSIRRNMAEKTQLFVKSRLSQNELVDVCTKATPPQRLILELVLQYPKGILLSELLEITEASKSPVETLAKKGVLSLEPVAIDRSPLSDAEFFQTKPKEFNSEQKIAFDKVAKTLSENRFETHLLYGVTGSGKTEVYLQAIDLALSQNKGVIFLVPEISLTTQTIERLKSRFEHKIALLHHRLSDGERRDTWMKIHRGETPLVVGPRSAIFSPLPNLGLIIVDEEHDSSYKQSDEMPCYHGRDIAIMRAKMTSSTVILGSATPSFESYTNAISGKYTLSTLKQRTGPAQLPLVKVIDLRREFAKAQGFTLFSDELLNGIKERQKRGEQTILFLNRRGFHTQQICQKCGHVIACPRCELPLTFHKSDNRLSCHLCSYELIPPPRSCPVCNTPETLKYKGAGTELVERSIHAILPDIRTLRIDGDTTSHKGSHEKFFKQFRSGKADVLIGTQMITKGLHFPAVTLVGILNADAALSIPDFRSPEWVFQLITQVSGRSGRGALVGEVIIQTHHPEHPVIQAATAQDYLSFYQGEIGSRKTFGFPPFSHLVKITLSGPHLSEVQNDAALLYRHLVEHLPPDYQIFPVTPCGHAKINDQYRFQVLIKGPTPRPITTLFESAPSLKSRLLIDVDPLSTFF